MGTLPGAGKLCRCFTSPKSEKPAYPEKMMLTRAIETFYDNCAAYNLRYVPYRTVTDQVSLQTIAKDLVVLFCFLVTSAVVLMIILTRIAMHLGLLCMEALQWSTEKIGSCQKTRQKRSCIICHKTIAPTSGGALANPYRRQNNIPSQPLPSYTEHTTTDVRASERINGKNVGNNQKLSQEKEKTTEP